MAVISQKIYTLVCDGCDYCTDDCGDLGAKSVRDYAKNANGWVRVRINGDLKDLCADCAANGAN